MNDDRVVTRELSPTQGASRTYQLSDAKSDADSETVAISYLEAENSGLKLSTGSEFEFSVQHS